ncbi:MAG: membrane protein insertase YidC [Alphaproteobacteria bacterium]|nr:membrane protein insertase YidC [Alphaproteobacteria bacterium]
MENNNIEKRNFVLAIVFSALLLFAVDSFFPSEQHSVPAPAAEKPSIENSNSPVQLKPVPSPQQAAVKSYAPTPSAVSIQNQAATTTTMSREQAVDEYKHISIKTPSVSGSLRLKGARLDNLSLTKYRETLEENSPYVSLLSPVGTEFPFFVEFGWVSSEPVLLPGSDTPWTTQDTELTPEKPITLSWDNGTGLKFIRQISVDTNYMFTVSDRIENYGSKVVTLFNYGLTGRTNVPEAQRGAVLEGMVGYLSGSLKEFPYTKMDKEGQASFQTTGGWAGITDKYWMTILAFDQNAPNVTVKFSEQDTSAGKHYQTDYLMPPTVIEPGQAVQTTNRVFAGAKELKLIDTYEKELGIKRFDLTVDFGWYYFLTKPFFFILSWFNSLFGNMGLAILFFAFLLRLAMFPIANKSFKNMAKMKELQPKMEKLRERYGEDKMRLNQEIMELYRQNNVNPASGCLPMLIQIPVFFSLYKVLYISLELRQAPFYGWIHDLSAPDPSSVFTLFGYLDWPVPSVLNIGVWPVAMGLTMWIQQQMSPKTPDRTQNLILMLMPVMMTFLLGHLASGLVIYWTWSNLLSMAQQYALKFESKKQKGKA